ncbi:MAG: cyclic nucleotide-binding domain-containing protein [Motiliproteus sp.]
MIDPVFLQAHALFGGVSDEQIPILVAHLNQEQYPPGAYLFHQEDAADRLFLITQGSVEVLSQTGAAEPVRLAVRGIGESIGEMALIDVQNRSASVRTLEPVVVLSLSHASLEQIYQAEPGLFTQIILNIAREISRRLRSMDALLGCALYETSDHQCRASIQTSNSAMGKGLEK